MAVLGNTGSGKSCSVAGLVRWSIEAVKKEKEKTEPFEDQRNDKERKTVEQSSSNDSVNCRFIVLDPNGEYFEAFKDVENARFFSQLNLTKRKVLDSSGCHCGCGIVPNGVRLPRLVAKPKDQRLSRH